MTSASSMSVSVECVNMCKFWKGDVSGRYDYSVLSCASKAPRTLIGFLASPAQPSQACGRASKRILIQPRSERHNLGGLCSYEASDFVPPQNILSSSVLHLACRNWKLHCSLSSSSQCYDGVSPESLWEDLNYHLISLSKGIGIGPRCLEC